MILNLAAYIGIKPARADREVTRAPRFDGEVQFERKCGCVEGRPQIGRGCRENHLQLVMRSGRIADRHSESEWLFLRRFECLKDGFRAGINDERRTLMLSQTCPLAFKLSP